MKKRLEAELISIAHRILKLKNKSELDQLYKESRKLYETLSVLKFYQDNFDLVKNTVSEEVLEEKLVSEFEKETPIAIVAEVSQVVENTIQEPIAELKNLEVGDESFEDNDSSDHEDKEDHESDEVASKEEPVFKPTFELDQEEALVEEAPIEEAKESKPVTFDTLLGENYQDPIFVKPGEASLFSTINEEIKTAEGQSLNNVLSSSIAIGLNDRIGFVKYLFGDSNEDFNRVLSQLNTFDTWEEAKIFIEEMVKPDYDNWKGQEDYEERFMEIVEKKFQ